MTSIVGDSVSLDASVARETGLIGEIASIGLSAGIAACSLWVHHSFVGQALHGRFRPLRPPTARVPKFAPYNDVQ